MSAAPAAECAIQTQAQRARTLDELAGYMARTLQSMDELLGVASDGIVDRFVNRVVAMSTEPWPHAEILRSRAVGRLAFSMRRFRSIVALVWRGLIRLPFLLQQYLIVRRSFPAGSVVAFGLASNRSRLSPHVTGIRANLALMTRPLDASQPTGFDRDVAEAEFVLLFDCLLTSDYWREGRRCWSENVVVVDGMFLAMFALLSWIARPRHAIPRTWRLFQASWREAGRPGRPARRSALWTGVICAIAGYGFSALLGGSRRLSGILLSRNSTLLETLRAYLVWAPQCRQVCEILHGMPAEHDAKFFNRFLEAGAEFGAREKHRLVPQVPNLPLLGVLLRQALAGGKTAINPRVNLLLADLAATTGDVVGVAVAERLRLERTGHPSPSRPLVVSLFGTDRLAGKLEYSTTFRAECLLLELFRGASDELGTPCALVYIPHPSGAAPGSSHPAFRKNNVRIGNSSLLAWLVSDLAVSLYSSAAFEAAYFGRRAFLPLVAGDGLFAPYLGMLNHPESASREDLKRAIKDVLRRCAADPWPECLAEEVRARLGRMGWASPVYA